MWFGVSPDGWPAIDYAFALQFTQLIYAVSFHTFLLGFIHFIQWIKNFFAWFFSDDDDDDEAIHYMNWGREYRMKWKWMMLNLWCGNLENKN